MVYVREIIPKMALIQVSELLFFTKKKAPKTIPSTIGDRGVVFNHPIAPRVYPALVMTFFQFANWKP